MLWQKAKVVLKSMFTPVSHALRQLYPARTAVNIGKWQAKRRRV
jgi:hypothetical protein